MNRSQVLSQIAQCVEELTTNTEQRYPFIPEHNCPLPSSTQIEKIMNLVKAILFPGYFGEDIELQDRTVAYYTGVWLEQVYDLLSEQIYFSLCFDRYDAKGQASMPDANCLECSRDKAGEVALRLIQSLPRIKYFMSTSVKEIHDGDPAVGKYSEVIFSYPAINAILYYRVAHELLLAGVPVLPRMISELAHSQTGIDIHPGATIGEYFSIDHGTGIVIGATCIIGNHVRLYQGVTLGAKSFTLDEAGNPVDLPRHPILEDNVTVYSNATILGRITIGRNSVVGGNVWLTHSVPEDSRILQSRR
ncbi:MAG: serine O-acetyltransferase [Tannerellaceae bacterium]